MWLSSLRIRSCHSVAQITAAAWVRFLAQKFLYTIGATKKKKIQIKTARYYYISIGWPKSGTLTTSNTDDIMEQKEHSITVGGNGKQ